MPPTFPDLVALALILVGTGTFTRWLWKKNKRGWSLFSLAWIAFNGFIISFLMLGHCVEILRHAFTKILADQGNSWTYDFRFYSLLLLSVILIHFGVQYLRTVVSLGRGEGAGLPIVRKNTLLILAIVVPLVPLQPVFAGLFVTLGLVTLIILLVLKPRHIFGSVG